MVTPRPGLGQPVPRQQMLRIADSYFDAIEQTNARVAPFADEEYGLVFGFPMFVHRGDVRTIRIAGVPGVTTIPRPFGPINLQAGEIFKIRSGKIHEIEANGFLLPYGAPSGWE